MYPKNMSQDIKQELGQPIGTPIANICAGIKYMGESFQDYS